MSESIAVIGTGMMGGAIIKSLLKGGYKGRIIAADFVAEKLREFEDLGVSGTTDNQKAVQEVDIVFVCVKPADLENVLTQISPHVKGKLLASVAATVPLWCLKKNAPEAKVVRIMPNIAALVQSSYTAFCCDKDVNAKEKETIRTILNTMGISQEIDEKHMDAITGLSGSGPGYLSIIAEALTYAGLKVGLPRNIAEKAAAQNMLGTAKLIIELQAQPSKIRDMVTTPGGTTIEAIYELESSGVRQALMRAVEKATKKSALIRKRVCPEPK